MKPAKRSSTRHELVLEQLMQAAERLFVQKGVGGTSVNELAQAIGVTRTGLYHYISGKEELLEYLVRGFSMETADQVQEIADNKDENAAARLRECVVAMAIRVAKNPQRFRLLLVCEGAFPDELAKQHRAARRRTFHTLSGLITQAVEEGICRPIDPELGALTLAGVANWVAFWFPLRHSTNQTPEHVAQYLADIALEGLFNSRAADGEAGIPQALRLLHEDVHRLEQLFNSAELTPSLAVGPMSRTRHDSSNNA